MPELPIHGTCPASHVRNGNCCFEMRLLRERLFRIGLVMFVIGTGPLLLSIAAWKLGFTVDKNPNPVGLGILAYFTFLPSVILIGAGIIKTLRTPK